MTSATCRDIFDAVYVNVKGSFLKNYDYVKVKSKTVSESLTEDENLSTTTISEPKSETNINTTETTASATETVRESVERVEEKDVVADIRKELEEKFPFALGAVCGNLATLDKLYREMRSSEAQPEFSSFFLDITDEFPLSDRFAFPCIMYVNSMVLIDVDEKKSDAFFEKYINTVSQIVAEIPPSATSIAEKYPY